MPIQESQAYVHQRNKQWRRSLMIQSHDIKTCKTNGRSRSKSRSKRQRWKACRYLSVQSQWCQKTHLFMHSKASSRMEVNHIDRKPVGSVRTGNIRKRRRTSKEVIWRMLWLRLNMRIRRKISSKISTIISSMSWIIWFYQFLTNKTRLKITSTKILSHSYN